MTHKFLAVLHTVNGWSLEDHGRLFRTLTEAKRWVEKTGDRQSQLCEEHDKRRERAVMKAKTKKQRLSVFKKFYDAQPFWFETAEVYELFQSGSLKLVRSFNTESKTGKDGDEWIGWSKDAKTRG